MWDDQGSRLLTVANYEHYTELMNGFRERMVRERARFIEDYDVNVDQARLDLGKLFRIEDGAVTVTGWCQLRVASSFLL